MKFKVTTLSIVTLVLLTNLLFTSLVQASTFDQILKGFKKTGTEAGFPVESSGEPSQEFTGAWIIYMNGLLVLMGMLFMILVIYGGWIWMTAQGNEEKVARGKNLIIQATIGLAIIIGARLIVELVILNAGSNFPATESA